MEVPGGYCHGYLIVGEYEDGRPGEILLKIDKRGSTLAGFLDTLAASVSIGSQHRIPLLTYVEMFVETRFEPAGVTDDADIRFASSVVDYVFRRLAVDYLPISERAPMGILTAGERMHPVSEQATESDPLPILPFALVTLEQLQLWDSQQNDPRFNLNAPYCYQCGLVMICAGACYVCPSCGTTSGCQ